jgi:hypothetical protein
MFPALGLAGNHRTIGIGLLDEVVSVVAVACVHCVPTGQARHALAELARFHAY